ncbi:MAG: eCIS core domain-containing protein [Sulfuricaulis sp.]
MKTHRFITRSFLLALVGTIGVGAPMSAFAEKSIEETTIQSVNDLLVQQGAPVLQALIARSRDDAVRAGVLPVPAEIRQHLAGFIPDAVLDAARYRVQGGDDLTLQVNAIRYGDAAAITLDDVIVFKKPEDALHNPTLWAHELTHVAQYQRWGIHEFSVRYLRNFQAVEKEANEAATRYAAGARN